MYDNYRTHTILSSLNMINFFFHLKPKISIKKHFIICSSINKMIGKTLLDTQQARRTIGGNQGFWVGRIKVTDNTKQPRGTLWECGVLGGEHRLYRLTPF